jgi:hypothetical protein
MAEPYRHPCPIPAADLPSCVAAPSSGSQGTYVGWQPRRSWPHRSAGLHGFADRRGCRVCVFPRRTLTLPVYSLLLLWLGRVGQHAPPSAGQAAGANYTYGPGTCIACEALVLLLAKHEIVVQELASRAHHWSSPIRSRQVSATLAVWTRWHV